MSDLKIVFIAAFFFSSEQAALITPTETMTHVQHLQPGGGGVGVGGGMQISNHASLVTAER